MKHIKKNWLLILFTFVSLFLISYLIITISLTNIIPFKYIIILLIVLFILNLIAILLHIPKNKVIRFFSYLLFAIIIISSLIGIKYTNKMIVFLKESFNNVKSTSVNKYILLTNEDYNDIYSFKDKKIGYYKMIPNINKALDKLSTAVNNEYIDYIEVNTLFKDMDNKIINGILIEESIYNSMKENIDTISFDKYKILYNFDVQVDKDTSTDKINNSFNIYISGADFTYSNSDFNMIVTVNRSTRKILLTSIPRDFHIYLPSMGMKDSLEFIAVWGIHVPIEGLENLFNIDLDYYLQINTKSLVNLVDTLGGIEFCSDRDFWTTHALILDSYNDKLGRKLHVTKGCKNYNGIEILTIARERNFNGGDRVRQENCRKIMISIANKMMSFDSITNFENILNKLKDLYTTNIPDKQVTNIIKDFLDGNKWDILTQEVNGSDGSGYVHLGTYYGYVMNPNMESVEKATNKIKEIYG